MAKNNTKILLLSRNNEEKNAIKLIQWILDLQYPIVNELSVLNNNSTKDQGSKLLLISEEMKYITKVSKDCPSLFTCLNHLIFNDNEAYLKLQEENIKSLIDYKPDLIIESLRQANYFIEFIGARSTLTKEQIMIEFTKNAINVLYIFDSKSSAKNYRKRELALSTDKINYIPYLTKNFKNWEIYPKFQVFLQRCPYLYLKDKNICLDIQKHLDTLKDVLVMDNMAIIEACFNRYNVYLFIKGFVDTVGSETLKLYNIKVSVPYTTALNIDEYIKASLSGVPKSQVITTLKEVFSKHIITNNFKFPLMIKPDPCTEHDMYLILNNEGLSNFINEENLPKVIKYKDYVVQEYISHDSVLFKSYYINGSTLTITRPSLPNMEGKNLEMKHFDNGCFKFHNEFLYSKKDESFVECFTKNEDQIGQKINYQALDYLCQQFVKIKGVSLFGLDFLYDQNTDTYYILEINYFPSYRELKEKLAEQFSEHIIKSYYSFRNLSI